MGEYEYAMTESEARREYEERREMLAELKSLREELADARKDQQRFSALRRIASSYGGVYIIHDEDGDGFSGLTVIGRPVDAICYHTESVGCDEQDAIDRWIEAEKAKRAAACTGSDAK